MMDLIIIMCFSIALGICVVKWVVGFKRADNLIFGIVWILDIIGVVLMVIGWGK